MAHGFRRLSPWLLIFIGLDRMSWYGSGADVREAFSFHYSKIGSLEEERRNQVQIFPSNNTSSFTLSTKRFMFYTQGKMSSVHVLKSS